MSVITLLDGGMGQELIHRAGGKPTPLWSAQVMLDHPEMVRGVHADFFAAGATVATTNTYTIHSDGLAGTAVEDKFESLYRSALQEARTAVAAHGTGHIAGSIGPLKASFRPDLHPPADIAIPLYSEIAALIADDCDILILETVASVDHADSLLTGAAVADKPIWLSLTVDDQDGTKLRSGEPLTDVIALAQQQAAAILINCSVPEAIPAGLDVLSTSGLPYGAYANAFEKITEDFLKDKPTVDALQKRIDLTPDSYADFAMS